MKEKKRIEKILGILKTQYPDVKTQLDHKNPFELLIATILSAQCTDRQVNLTTPALFSEFPDPYSMMKADIADIERLVKSTGFYHNKAKNIKNCASVLVEKFDGEVPRTLDALVSLPGVGRKTANVVLGMAFAIPGMVVDTHVARISARLGLTKSKNPVQIEKDLMEIIPEDRWNDFSLELIMTGRGPCKARNPSCQECHLFEVCAYPQKQPKDNKKTQNTSAINR